MIVIEHIDLIFCSVANHFKEELFKFRSLFISFTACHLIQVLNEQDVEDLTHDNIFVTCYGHHNATLKVVTVTECPINPLHLTSVGVHLIFKDCFQQ